MAKNDWWFKFQYSKWDDPELRLCSLEAQGFWLRIYTTLRKQGQSSITATVEDLARIVGGNVREVKRSIAELQEHRAADVTLCNAENVTCNSRVTLTSRSLLKELSGKEKTRLRVDKHRKQQNVTLVKRDRVKSKELEVRKEEELRGANAPLSVSTDEAAVFEHWQKTLGHEAAKFTKDRRVKIRARLAEKYTVEDLKRAVDGCLRSPHHMGINDRGVRYDGIDLIFRNGENVERFIGYLDAVKPSNGNGTQLRQPVNEAEFQRRLMEQQGGGHGE